jgi:very-short-patch-repair endonuclease
MASSKGQARSARAWRLARAQHGVVARRQLLALGFTRGAIAHRLRTGRLHLVERGVYAVGRRELTPHGRWMAAVLACGEGAVLSHRSAAAVYGICAERRGAIEITVRRSGMVHRDGLKVRRRPSLPEADVGTLRNIPITSPARTVIDLATVLGPKGLERAVNDADKLDLIDPETLRREVDARPGVPGVRPLRRLLDRDTFVLFDDELERLFLPLALESGLPLPRTREMVNGFEVDFHWPELRLVVETDGLRYHRTPSAQARDALRDQTHTAAGYARLRFPHFQVRHEPDHVRRVLRATVARLTRQRT